MPWAQEALRNLQEIEQQEVRKVPPAKTVDFWWSHGSTLLIGAIQQSYEVTVWQQTFPWPLLPGQDLDRQQTIEELS